MGSDRREFLLSAGVVSMGGMAALLPGVALADDKKEQTETPVSAPEDLMREHGVLNRILLIYEEGLRRLHNKEDVPPEVFQHPAELVRKFVEDYHEKLEENFIFPIFERHRKLTDLVAILRRQHQAGRDVTDVVLRNATGERWRDADNRRQTVLALRAFIRMYRPHETREDTVLFPALHWLMSEKEMNALGDKFEAEENRLFGNEGFEKTVDKVAEMEKHLGIYDLNKFTPKLPLGK